MFNYRLKNENTLGVLETVFNNRDITQEEANKILSPNKNVLEDGSMYANMEKGIELLRNSINNNNKIATLIDEDFDGYASSSIIYNFIKEKIKYNNIDYILHNKAKVHGLTDYVVDYILENKIDLIICPDSASNDIESHTKLLENGVKILILDHHLIDSKIIENKNIALINNNLEPTKNKFLSGTGVTYKFIETYSKKYDININKKYIDLVACSLISDMCNMSNLENRYLFNNGRQKVFTTNLLLKSFYGDIQTEELSITDIGFKIVPFINSVIRLGTMEQKEMMFKAFAEHIEFIDYKKRGVGIIQQSIQDAVVRISKNTKSKQDKEIKKIIELIKNRISEKQLDNNKVIICNTQEIENNELNGLAANKLVDIYNKPVLLFKEKDGVYMGSARGVNNCKEIEDFKKLCLDTDCFNFCLGHSNAFGFSINKKELIKANNIFNEKLEGIEIDRRTEVDYIFNNINLEDVISIAEYQDLWSNSLKEPKFVIRNIKINSDEIKKIGTSTYIFNINKVNFTKFFGSKNWIDNIIKKQDNPFGDVNLELEILCTFRKNSKGYSYVDIIDINSEIYNIEEDIF